MNKFELKEQSLINKAKSAFDKSKPMFRCDGSDAASWTDDWVCFPKNRRLQLIFSNWVKDPQRRNFDIARVYVLEMVNNAHSHTTSAIHALYAFRALEVLGKPLGTAEQSDLNNLDREFEKKKYNRASSGAFWSWCKKRGLVASFLVTPITKEARDRSAEEALEQGSKKLIVDEQVAAVGVAYNELFSDEGIKKYGFKNYPKEYLAIAFSALSLSTPSRMSIETFCLPDQDVKEHYDDEGNKSHSLFWKGSKNHPDNRTHLLSSMAGSVERVLEVLRSESTPAKILSLFMSRPNLSLNQVMEAYPNFNYKLNDYPSLDLNSQSSIFHLGLILGFYYEEPMVPVTKAQDQTKVISLSGNLSRKYLRRLSEVTATDYVIGDSSIVPLLVGNVENDSWLEHCNISNAFSHFEPVFFKGKELSTLWDMTQAIIETNRFFNGSVDRIVRGKDVSVKISDAFFVYTTAMLRGVEEVKNSNSQKYGVQTIAIPYIYNLLTSDKRPNVERSWIQSALKLVGLEKMAFSPHQLRHWMNHHAKESGIPIEVINLWSGRMDADQAYEYIHTIDEDNAHQISSILVRRSEVESNEDIKMISLKKIENLRQLPANVMSEGVCIQDLVTMPCRFLNDFTTSCFGCDAMCYIRGDEKVVDMLKTDLSIQKARLSDVKSRSGFSSNKASQEWYKVHFNKTAVLNSLLSILQDESIPFGSSVILVGDLTSIEFRIQNLDNGKVTVVKQTLEDGNKSLKRLIESTPKRTGSSNYRLNDLLSKYGVNDDKSSG